MSEIFLFTLIALLPLLLRLFLPFAVTIVVSPIVGLLLFRINYVLPSTNNIKTRPQPCTRKAGTPTRIAIVLGSGGHTSEMLQMLRDLDTKKWTHRTYIVSEGDDFSAARAEAFENALSTRDSSNDNNGNATTEEKVSIDLGGTGTYDIATVPRARRIHQPIFTTPFSSTRCLYACLFVLGPPGRSNIRTSASSNFKPQIQNAKIPPHPHVVLTNGPATGVIVVSAALLLQIFGITTAHDRIRSVYVESWARVRRLSLSGKILLRLGLVDRFIVQWKSLAKEAGCEFVGGLVG